MTPHDEIGSTDEAATGTPVDLLEESIGRHPTAVGRRLDTYLALVAEALRDRRVVTGPPRRTDAAHRLIGSIVLDCTAVLTAVRTAGADRPAPPAPVIATWDEQDGWCVGLHEDPARSSRRYLHHDLLPPPQSVAGFVVGLGPGRPARLTPSRQPGGARTPATPPRAMSRRVGPPGAAPPAVTHGVEPLDPADTSTSCEFALDADPSAPRASRDRVGGWLAAARWPEDEVDAIVYAVSEAVSNAAEHAYPPGSAGRVAVVGRIEDAARSGAGPMRQVRVSVRDEGRWRMAPAVDEGRRRGLLLMAALMDDVCVRSGCDPPAGTEVAMTSTAIPA